MISRSPTDASERSEESRPLGASEAQHRDALNPLLSGEETAKLVERELRSTPAGQAAFLNRELTLNIFNALTTQAVRIAELEKDSARFREALDLITRQDPNPSNSPDPGHEHYLRLVLISIAKTALGDGTLKDNITAARATLAAQQDQKGEGG